MTRIIGIYRPQASRADFLGACSPISKACDPAGRPHRTAHLFSDPDATPSRSSTGGQLDRRRLRSCAPAGHRREWLKNASLCALHGTRRGLLLALNIARSACKRRIAVIEDFRLRRILATLLGVDLAATSIRCCGLTQSGNSVVGDTLVLATRASRAARLSAGSRERRRNDRAELLASSPTGTVLVHQTWSRRPGLDPPHRRARVSAHVDVRVATLMALMSCVQPGRRRHLSWSPQLPGRCSSIGQEWPGDY